MALQAGRTLGHYEILSSLGAGGMGEVYRARDTRLGREVAIKLILAEVARDAERLSRFEREARVLASLNHPRIATLHGFESEGDTRFLVMELVEGETLADRIARGPLPVDEAVALFLQIAEGLEAAHEKGVVHRDLKPANVKVSEDGAQSGARVKILDFGLAKAMAPADAVRGSDPALSASPTMTLAATMRGELLGTAAYMSPEQAAGKVVDKRADIWAFGVCLYEALTGRRPFHGEDAANTLASVLRDPIDLEALPAGCPPRLRGLIGRCLVRDARNRLRDIGDARLEMEAIASGARQPEGVPAASSATTSRAGWLWLAAGLAAGIVVSLAAARLLSRGAETSLGARDGRSVTRSTIDLTELSPEPDLVAGLLTISPDGSLLTLAAGVNRSRLYFRRMDDLAMRPLAGTEGAWTRTAFSPDGRWFGFWTFDGTVSKMPLNGGPAIQLATAADYWGGAWDRDGTFLYAPDGSGLYRLPAAGGEPERVTRVDTAAGEVSHRHPSLLPDGKGVIFSVKVGAAAGDSRVVALSYQTNDIVTLIDGGYDGRYAASGHLIYGSDGSLYAAPMDLDPPRITGSAVAVVTGVKMDTGFSMAAYSFSDDGTLVYVPEAADSAFLVPLQWVDREGRREVLSSERRNFTEPRLSPSGSTLALTVTEGHGYNTFVYDLERGVASRLTTSGNNSSPVWTPDGQRIVFSSARTGSWDLYWQRADGSEEAQALTDDVVAEYPGSMSRDGVLAYSRAGKAADIWTLEPGSGEEPTPFLASADDETNPVFSPDGKWIAYELEQGKAPEIFVVPYPAGGRRVKISIDGGVSPVWSRASQELFYLERGERMMVVDYQAEGSEFRPGVPRLLFEARTRMTGWPTQLFDVTPDGRRFVMPEAADLSKAKVVLVQNWFEELKRLVPTSRD